MKDLIQKLGPILVGSATVVANLRKLLAESRPNGADARIDAVENALQVQSSLNESLDVQVRLIHELLKKTQKRLQIVVVALIATGTVAALALAVAAMK
jgi:1-aminocyclopropane-1-carboxylate deaminase/D-cysteine desulfhydrase-like pyridoxal-dependent ACC family enzyme